MGELILTRHGNNANIKIHILSDDEMVKAGFGKTCSGDWYKCVDIGCEISFNVTIYMDGDWRIDVLDEDFLQPYDYQALLEQDPHLGFAKKVKLIVDGEMGKLIKAGIVSGWKVGDYL